MPELNQTRRTWFSFFHKVVVSPVRPTENTVCIYTESPSESGQIQSQRHCKTTQREPALVQPSLLIGRLASIGNQASESWTASGCDDTSPGAHSAPSLTPPLRPPPLAGINQPGDHQEWRSAPGEPRNPSVAVPNPRGGGGDRHFILRPSPPRAFGEEELLLLYAAALEFCDT